MLNPGNQIGGDDQFQALRGALDELAQLDQESAAVAAAGAADDAAANPIEQFCAIWPTVRRAIDIILRLPFIPGGVKGVLRQLLTIGDLLCRSS